MTAPKRLWVVVKVESGVPVTAEAYRDERTARRRERLLRKRMHPENDETGIFRIKIGKATITARGPSPAA